MKVFISYAHMDQPFVERPYLAQLHDVLEEVDGRWRYRVELMRRWVSKRIVRS